MNEITTEDILQHVGVKGMKWGVRRKERNVKNRKIKADIKSGKVDKSTGKAQMLNNYHKSKKKGILNATYQNDYQQARTAGVPHLKAVSRAKISSRASNAMILGMGAVGVTGLAGQGAGAAYRKATSPEAIRAGKNIINAVKKSPIRHFEGGSGFGRSVINKTPIGIELRGNWKYYQNN